MGSKINESVWGTVPETGAAIRVAPNTLGTCYNNGTFDPDNISAMDKTIVPWGVPYCGLGGMSFLKKLRMPIPIEGTANMKAGTLTTFDIEEFVETNNPIALMMTGNINSASNNNWFSHRLSGAVNSSATAFTSNAASDRDTNIPAGGSSQYMWQFKPIVYLDYQKVMIQVQAVILWDKVSGNRIVTGNLSNYPASGKTWNDYELLGFQYEIYYRNASNAWITSGYYTPIPINEKDISNFVLDRYFGQQIRPQKWTPYTYSAQIKTTFYSDTGSYNITSTAITTEVDSETLFSGNWSNELRSYGNFINGTQTFDNVAYSMDKKCGFVSGGTWFEIVKGSELPGSEYYPSNIQIGVYYKIKDYEPGTSKASAWAKIIAHEIAFLGLPFQIKISGDSGTPAATATIADDDVFLPIFDMDHMVTTGRYTTDLAEKQALPNYTWENIFDSTIPDWDSSYNPPKPGPGPGPGPGPDPNPNPLYPSSPGFSLASAGGKCYALVDGTIDTIFEEIYGRDDESWLDLINGLSLYGADPMAAIISYKWYPWAWNFSGTAGLYLGGIRIGNSAYDVPRTDAEALHTENASFYYGREKNFINSRHSQARLWLPFYGFYALPQQKFISEKLTVDFHYNLPDEVGVWIISFDDVIYDFVECQCSIDVPLSATDYRGQKYAAISGVLSAAGNLINSVGDVAKSAVSVGIGTATAAGAASAYKADIGESIFSSIRKQGIGALQAFDGTQRMQIGMMGSGATQAAGGAIGAGTSVLGGISQGFNDVMSTRRTLNQMKINLPYHGAASPTTFLNLPMFPFVQVYTNNTIDDYVGKDSQYKLKNGHACDKWVTASEMPSNSLCQASGIADMDTSGMELSEVEELNSILQSGFFIAIE